MKRNFFRCTLMALLMAGWAMAQAPLQPPQQSYPSENSHQAQQQQQQPETQNPQQTPTTQTKPGYPEENPKTPSTTPAPQSSPRQSAGDEALKSQLQHTLAANSRLSDVQPVVSGGQVTLTGTVPTEADRSDAKRMIEEVAGVNKVVDEMTIGTPSHMPPGGSVSSGNALPQSDVYGKGSSAQGAAHGCECKKGQNNGKYPGTDEPCACSGSTTHSGESLPKDTQPPKPVPPKM